MVDVGARWGISKTKPKTSATPKSKVRKTSSKPKAKSRPAAQLADRWGLRPSRLKPKTLARASSAASSSASVPKRPVDEDAEAECLGPADETDLQHTARHSANSDQCSRCRQISSLQFIVVVTCFFQFGHKLCFVIIRCCDRFLRFKDRWEQIGSLRHTSWGKPQRTTWLAQRPGRRGGTWALGCVFCAHLVHTLAKYPAERKRLFPVLDLHLT